ncbi:MAG: hypothetical protein CMP14_02455 [Rickettsiales bacterium]|nr:hypothetical protein [Rickettsiales bacterium]
MVRDTPDEASFALHQWLRFRHPIASIFLLIGAATFSIGTLVNNPAILHGKPLRSTRGVYPKYLISSYHVCAII